MRRLCRGLWELVEDDAGQDLVEYAFLITFLALLIAATLQSTQTSVGAVFSRIIDAVDAAS